MYLTRATISCHQKSFPNKATLLDLGSEMLQKKKEKKKPCVLMYIMKWWINFSFLSLTFCVWKKLVKLWMKVWNFVSSKKWESCKQEISSSSCKLREYCAYAKKSKNMTTNIDNQFSRPFTAKHEDFMYF